MGASYRVKRTTFADQVVQPFGHKQRAQLVGTGEADWKRKVLRRSTWVWGSQRAPNASQAAVTSRNKLLRRASRKQKATTSAALRPPESALQPAEAHRQSVLHPAEALQRSEDLRHDA